MIAMNENFDDPNCRLAARWFAGKPMEVRKGILSVMCKNIPLEPMEVAASFLKASKDIDTDTAVDVLAAAEPLLADDETGLLVKAAKVMADGLANDDQWNECVLVPFLSVAELLGQFNETTPVEGELFLQGTESVFSETATFGRRGVSLLSAEIAVMATAAAGRYAEAVGLKLVPSDNPPCK